MVDRIGIDDALADGRRDLQMKNENRDEIEKRSPDHRLMGPQHTGGNDGRDGVRGVVKTVHEVEDQRKRDQDHQGRERDCRVHAQTFSTTTDSMTFATSWHLSVASSRYS